MIYFFDGSIDGFLTAFIQAFLDKDAVISSRKIQLSLGQNPLYVDTDTTKALQAKQRLLSFDSRAERDLAFLLRSGEEGSEQAAFLYLRLLAQTKKPIRGMLHIDVVFDAVQRIKRVGLEIHRFHGFIRFIECSNGVLYAPCSPDHDICDLLLPHFKARLGGIPLIIHDVKRKKAAVFDERRSIIIPLDNADVLIADAETDWQTRWKAYYKAVNIPSRQREKQMRGYMPTRYHTFLTERQA